MWSKLNQKQSKYHWSDSPFETACGLVLTGAQIVEHKIIQNKGKCKTCLRIVTREKYEQSISTAK